MNNKNFAVGLFVAVALTIFVGATIWLTGRQGSEPTLEYSMFFEKDVGGLMLGGPVFYLGVEVGTVTSMNIVPGNPMRVRVDIEVLKSAPVNAGSFASLAFQGITGVAVIKLKADPGLHETLQIGEDSRFPVITVRDSGFSALLDMAPTIAEKLDSVLQSINEIMGEENRELVSRILDDMASVTETLAAEKDFISELPGLLRGTINELDTTIVQIKSTVEKLEPGMESTLANLEQATASLAKMSARIETWTATNDKEMNAFMADGLGQFPALVSDARATLREVEKLVKDLREDPSKLIYQPQEDTVEVER
ncbi:MAG: MlaD family protein [Xanthomonadales bacterium]|nr:MlaD family protein [Xanthomonadales bacterium]